MAYCCCHETETQDNFQEVVKCCFRNSSLTFYLQLFLPFAIRDFEVVVALTQGLLSEGGIMAQTSTAAPSKFLCKIHSEERIISLRKFQYKYIPTGVKDICAERSCS